MPSWIRRPSKTAFSSARRAGLLLLLGCAATAAAQSIEASGLPVSSSCIDHLPLSAFTRVAVFAYVNPQDSVSAAFAQSADNFLQEVVTRAQRQLGATEGKLPAGEPIVNWRGAAKDLHLIAYKDGRIAVVDRDTTSVVTAASLLAHAIDSMSTIGELEWSADSARDSVRFDIAFVRPILDSAGHVTKATSERQAVPVFSILAPWERLAQEPPGLTPPRYPDVALRERYRAERRGRWPAVSPLDCR